MESFRLFVGIVLLIVVLILDESKTCTAQGLKTATTTTTVKCSRKHSAVLTDFGGVGDGVTSNTKAFKAAIDHLSPLASDGGAQLIVPPGKWLTGSFNLTSHFTLFLHKDAVILASQEASEYPIILEAFPSYGARKNSTGRHSSLMMGRNLTDVVITGHNGTIDGQGASWWAKYKAQQLNNVGRPHILQILFSTDIQISNLTLLNSPSWFLHPLYSSNIIFQGLTILSPLDSPNTDGITPDSCSNVRIEDCYINTDDDCVTIKSGLDQNGIKMGMPSEHIIIRRLTCISRDNNVISLGSEMSGGIKDLRAEDVTAVTAQSAIAIRTASGRGGYIKDIFTRRFVLKTLRYVVRVNAFNTNHADDYDPSALSEISSIKCRDMMVENVTAPAKYEVIPGNTFTGVCFSNTTATIFPDLKTSFKVESWDLLPHANSKNIECPYPQNKLPIEDVALKTCSL
ncbi:hypothetical protein G4B88_019468 [Cannabis sativa]|uniref:Polygalacturonase n=1 Tax=Cannabis sativa TaxID=3483 RepID=A0A7J6HZJ5_CANSA|nr:hypothetical protein G4B88_019468 [Cannabis sativa]